MGLPIGAAALLCLIALAQSLRELPSVTAFIQRHPGIVQSVPSVELRLPLVVRGPAFSQHVLHAVHHAGGLANLGRPSKALLGTGLHAGDGLVSLPGPSTKGADLDR